MRIRILFSTLFILFFVIGLYPQKYKIIETTEERIKIEISFENVYNIRDTVIQNKNFNYIAGGETFYYRNPGEPWLPELTYHLGITSQASPSIENISFETKNYSNINIIPFPKEDPSFSKILDLFDSEVYTISDIFPKEFVKLGERFTVRHATLQPLVISPFQFNPVTRELVFYKKAIITVRYNHNNNVQTLSNKVISHDPFSDEYLKENAINYDISKRWQQSYDLNNTQSDNYWYNPNKSWFKLFLKDNGVYRITYDELVNSGVPISLINQFDKVAMYSLGEPVFIDVFDLNDDNIFNSGDYFQFIGYPMPKSPYAEQNIYNLTNVYWLTFESDSLVGRYNNVEGISNFYVRNYQSNYNTIHYEKDLMYEKLGHAINDQQDYWYWDRAVANNSQPGYFFTGTFPTPKEFNYDLNYLNVKVGLMGITKNDNCNPDHSATIQITGKTIGDIKWDGQSHAIFDKTLNLATDSVGLYPEGNNLQVLANGEVCTGTDEIRINWFKLTYNRYNRVDTNHYYFSTQNLQPGVNRYQIWNWEEDSMFIYSPANGKKIINPEYLNDIWSSVVFIDTLEGKTLDYYCVSENHFKRIDSIKYDVPSDLRNTNNGADYLIITHSKFLSVANRLAEFRQDNFPDTTIPNPRIKVVDVDNIYDEFSYGLLDPFALQEYAKHTFYNYQAPAPLYFVIVGDMSYDYRKIFSNSRPSFVPAIPYHSFTYGQSASDNNIVAFVGNDLIPDMIVGRLSCETVEEGNILIDKIINYPSDDGKLWKQNVLLISSGLDANDENYFRFNESNMFLDENYLKPVGITSRKVFRYINRPDFAPFQGEGLQIRNGFNEGAVIASYYGHGGGYQWDLVFNNDDIYQLVNGGRMPVVLSVTCYTAHFDNQDVFGEQFNKVPGKGSIGFFGSSGLTLWGIGKAINQSLFYNIFRNKDYIIGKAIFKAKSVSSGGFYDSQLALLTYLGDPLVKLAIPDYPDFTLRNSDIKIEKNNLLVGDTVTVTTVIRNLGITFPGDSVSVKITASSVDTSYVLGINQLASFGEMDSLSFPWVLDKGGLFELQVIINEDLLIKEMDYNDNSAKNSFAVFDLTVPNVVRPFDGYSTAGNVEFVFVDNGYYVDENLVYYIQIDTALNFNNPLVATGGLTPSEGLLKWAPNSLPSGDYFWRTRIYTVSDSSEWSSVRSFSITENPKEGFLAKEKSLTRFRSYNMLYSNEFNSLLLNIEKLPPRPSNSKFVEDIVPTLPEELKALNSIATDGKYIYAGHLTYFDGLTKIYKIGTGNNGTINGEMYGTVSDHTVKIWHTMTYHKGYLYFAQEDPYYLLRMNVETGDTMTFFVAPGLLNQNGQVKEGAFSINSDGERFYALGFRDSLGNEKYSLRIIDTDNDNWTLNRDIVFPDRAYPYYTSFFVSGNYLFVYENYWGCYMRRINLDTREYEEEWFTALPVEYYYAWALDPINNLVYGSVYRSDRIPKIAKFVGEYIDAVGNVTSPSVGPAKKWNKVDYEIERVQGEHNVNLYGYNTTTALWDTLLQNVAANSDISQIDAAAYPLLRAGIEFIDSSFTSTNQIKFKSINIDYVSLPEITMTNSGFTFSPDSVLQGYDSQMSLLLKNIGYSKADSITVDFFINESDSIFYSAKVSVDKDSSLDVGNLFNTAYFPPATKYEVTAIAKTDGPEFFKVNNLARNSFVVLRDSVKPNMEITFDGEEIINNDIISATPEVIITMKDDSPLPLDKSYFTLVHTEHAKNKRNILSFDSSNISFNYTPYPNSEAKIVWTPSLGNGKHTLEVLGKDASGNFHDSTSHKSIFQVYTEPDLKQVFNYPNPFKNDTHFTFELRGTEAPDEFHIKIYTVAGRLIRDISIPTEMMKIGFNKYYWDGRDQDGDEIANGVYFYKVIYKYKDIIKTEIEKLAKVK